jgi:hypothetical protein
MFKKILKEILCVGYFAACFMLLFGVNLKAYIDPSVVTYVIQAVAGIAVAVGAAVGIYWRKAKKKINNKLGIDENKNKIVETDDIEVK